MKIMKFEKWLKLVKWNLLELNLIKEDTTLCKGAWKEFWKNKMTPIKAIKTDLGIEESKLSTITVLTEERLERLDKIMNKENK